MTHKWAMTCSLEIVFHRWFFECELTGNLGDDLHPFEQKPVAFLLVLGPGQAVLPRVSPLEGSQFHWARKKVEAEPLVLAAWALEQLCL